MSAFEEHKEELEHYEQMVGQHGVYCTSQRNPTLPAMDIRIIANELTNAKELVQSVMEELRRTKEETQS